MKLTAEMIERLETIQAGDDEGVLKPQAVVEDAKRKSSPLHDLFNWNKDEAAMAHWLDRAREIIRSVKVEITTSTRTITSVAYVRDPSSPHDEAGYVSVASLRDDKELARIALVRELKQARALFERAYGLAEALELTDDFDEFKEKLEAINLKLAA